MVKDSTKRSCSSCGNNGHNKRTCEWKGTKLFGAWISDDSSSKSQLTTESAQIHQEKKKVIPWTEEEHGLFLKGLQTYGRGNDNYRKISKFLLPKRTPLQIQSHAQKHFIKRDTLFDEMGESSIFDNPASERIKPNVPTSTPIWFPMTSFYIPSKVPFNGYAQVNSLLSPGNISNANIDLMNYNQVQQNMNSMTSIISGSTSHAIIGFESHNFPPRHTDSVTSNILEKESNSNIGVKIYKPVPRYGIPVTINISN